MKAEEAYILSRGFTKKSLDGLGAIKGKNATLESYEHDDENHCTNLVFKWTGDSGTVEHTTVPIPDGQDGSDGHDGADGQDGADGNGIKSIEKTATAGLVDTYTITFDDDTTTTFMVTNGADGQDGQDGADGEGVPEGGSAGQILKKKTGTNYDTEWADPEAASLPAGGTTGQVLSKKSNDDGDVEWADAGSVSQIQSDWNQSDSSKKDYIKNKPTIPDAQIQSDWNQSDNSAKDFIKNKPTLGTAAGKNVPASGDAASTEVVMGDDSRLTDPRTPTSHTHTKSDITDFPTLGTAAAKDVTTSITSGSTDVPTAGAVKDEIDAAVSSAYHAAGTKTVAELTSALLIAANEGDVYNMTDAGTTTADFIEGEGKPIRIGDNVGVAKVDNAYKFDLLSGFVDTSTFIEKSSTSGLVKNDGSIDETAYAKQSEMSITDGTGADAGTATIQLKSGTSKKVLTAHQDISGKADIITSPTNNNLVAMDANGDLKDAGEKISDFQKKALSVAIIIGGVSQTTVEDALNALNGMSQPGGYLPSVKIGESYSADLKQDISTGAFSKVFVGGYFEINNHIYDVAHLDYWLHTGDTECTDHHAVIVPRTNLVSGKMNSTNITTGGYTGSDFKTGANSNTALADIKAIIQADFGAANILTHREYFIKEVTNGRPSAGEWVNSDVDLMNEQMVYGCPVFEAANDGTNIPALYTIDKSQLKLFQERPDLITNRADWWLRSVVSATDFARVNSNGNASYIGAGNAYGVRPAFAIC